MRIVLRVPKRCQCGKCVGCRENARWENIFEQKYGKQERDYYAERRHVPGVSANALVQASVYAFSEECVGTTPKVAVNSLERFLKSCSTVQPVPFDTGGLINHCRGHRTTLYGVPHTPICGQVASSPNEDFCTLRRTLLGGDNSARRL
jgi:hypothetical protein